MTSAPPRAMRLARRPLPQATSRTRRPFTSPITCSKAGLDEQAVPAVPILALLLVPPRRHPVPHLRVRLATRCGALGFTLVCHATFPSLAR